MHEKALFNVGSTQPDRSCQPLQENVIELDSSLDAMNSTRLIGTGFNVLTEAMAATSYARAWNSFDPSEFIELLAPECRYASQWVFDELIGKSAIADYLIRKMHMVKAQAKKNNVAPVLVELGRTTQGFADRHCVIRGQSGAENLTAAVLFKVNAGKVIRYDLCLAKPLAIVRSGVYPL